VALPTKVGALSGDVGDDASQTPEVVIGTTLGRTRCAAAATIARSHVGRLPVKASAGP
jgi:hypothetical protein